jgi:O-antigen ligase
VALAVPVVVALAAGAGWLAAQDPTAGLAVGFAVVALWMMARLRPVQWVCVWLVASGLLGSVRGVYLPGHVAELTIERATVLLGLVSLLIRRRGTSQTYDLNAIALCFALFSADYIGMGLLFSPDFVHVVTNFWHHYVSSFVVFGLVITSMDGPSDQRIITRTAIIMGAVLACTGVLQALVGWQFGYERGVWGSRVLGALPSPPVLGAALSILMFLSASALLNETVAWRLAAAAACTLMLPATLLTLTRGAWLAVLGGGVVLALGVGRRRTVAGLLLVAALIAVVVAAPYALDSVASDPRLQSVATAEGRIETDLLLWNEFLAHPLFGEGPLTFYTFPDATGFGTWVSHNSFLSLLVATGLLGAFLYLLPVVKILSSGSPTVQASRQWRDVSLFALAGAVAYVINASAIDMIYFSLPHGLFWLCLGLVAANRRVSVDRSTADARFRTTVWMNPRLTT